MSSIFHADGGTGHIAGIITIGQLLSCIRICRFFKRNAALSGIYPVHPDLRTAARIFFFKKAAFDRCFYYMHYRADALFYFQLFLHPFHSGVHGRGTGNFIFTYPCHGSRLLSGWHTPQLYHRDAVCLGRFRRICI